MLNKIIFVYAFILVLLLKVVPMSLGSDMTGSRHSYLTLFLFGICGCFVGGLNFIPENKLMRFLLNKYTGVISSLIGLILLLLTR